MAKEKEQPFNYNGAYILAEVAYFTKDYDTSLDFYKICQDEAPEAAKRPSAGRRVSTA